MNNEKLEPKIAECARKNETGGRGNRGAENHPRLLLALQTPACFCADSSQPWVAFSDKRRDPWVVDGELGGGVHWQCTAPLALRALRMAQTGIQDAPRLWRKTRPGTRTRFRNHQGLCHGLNQRRILRRTVRKGRCRLPASSVTCGRSEGSPGFASAWKKQPPFVLTPSLSVTVTCVIIPNGGVFSGCSVGLRPSSRGVYAEGLRLRRFGFSFDAHRATRQLSQF